MKTPTKTFEDLVVWQKFHRLDEKLSAYAR
jgi:hypothetical protein